jgi:GGDEF domain-containing protein
MEIHLQGKLGAVARKLGFGEEIDEQARADLLVKRAIPRAEAGRKLAMYDRETGLLAYWYISLRIEEECYRAARYSRPMTLLISEPAPTTDAWEVSTHINQWLTRRARRSDVAGYVGNARYVIMMPETRLDAARRVANRLRREVEGAQVGLSAYPVDGQSYDQLVATAARRLQILSEVAA